ncbi:hypothetical protein BC939DRAFT_500240 [Gamsiella multidivaricata]|uniref:uncharacterized protein n=1 Tax=Gamsiella multidivaricata TaxID=101098 RepID=UPI00221FBBBD|nr:uncharacterized protein BC939DRAFT_500240 [Gamsiella multidivaricata]KAG0358378.1 hypothetical protein BGZ54_010450 [Gamsiella multidivaricata]KAI7829399.1 hypothetical protein BC939DRAFT_500240 [Gamsiella multidivaricata]
MHDNHDMDYAVDVPVHPFTSGPSLNSYSSRPQSSAPHHSSLPSIGNSWPQQPQQLVKSKSLDRYPPTSSPPQQMNAPDIVMTYENVKAAPIDSDQSTQSSSIAHAENMEDEQTSQSSPYQGRAHLAVDTSPGSIGQSSRTSNPVTPSPMTASTPTSAPLTSNSGVTAPSSRRSSLRTMTATLPRSALQEETIALFKQYRNLIPCAKCFSRNTIQRDGMSDGNLRFKCRPPVSMSLICNKSYSESKIRNMIASVVYGHTLPDSTTPTSAKPANGSSENILALPPPHATKTSRRPSHKNEDGVTTGRPQQLGECQAREGSMELENQQSYEEMNINGGHPHPVDDRRSPQEASNRRPFAQLQYHRPSAAGKESPMTDNEESTMPPPSNHLQVPGTPPLESDDTRLYRAHSTFSHGALTPTGHSSSSLNAATRQGQKLHHSHSHPNFGQQRHQKYLEQQEHYNASHGYSSRSPQYQAQQQLQQRLPQRQVMRRESAQYYGSVHPRPETMERRFSYPAALQPSSSSKLAPLGHSGDARSPAMSSTSSSPPGHEPLHHALGQPDTPQMGLLPGSGNRYEEASSPASYYQRRMSQPHPSSQRSFGQLPPPIPGTFAHQFDRRASQIDEFSYQHCEKYERLNASTMRHSSNKMFTSPYSSTLTHNQDSMEMPQSAAVQGARTSQTDPARFSRSMMSLGSDSGNRHAYSRHHDSQLSAYYQQPQRAEADAVDPYAPDDLSAEESDARPYARVHQGYKKPNTGQSLTRLSSHPTLYSTSVSASRNPASVPLSRNMIKLTCFPNAMSPTDQTETVPSITKLDTSDAMAMCLGKSSKVVIEITQPRHQLAFEPSRVAMFLGLEGVPGQLQRSLRHTASQPNLLTRSTTSILGRRRSVSPDEVAFGSSKKRRADSVSGMADEDEGSVDSASASATAAEVAATVVVAAATNAVRQQHSGSVRGLQVVGLDSESSKKIGLGVQVPMEGPTAASPTIEALSVAKASSYVELEDQKEQGIDYSLFTRVETAGWRILIPPNVMASFVSDDFGLTLKPKCGGPLSPTVAESTEGRVDFGKDSIPAVKDTEGDLEARKEEDENASRKGDEEMAEDGAMAVATTDEGHEQAGPYRGDEVASQGEAMENEEELDELEEE